MAGALAGIDSLHFVCRGSLLLSVRNLIYLIERLTVSLLALNSKKFEVSNKL